jgi:hypothetical protein
VYLEVDNNKVCYVILPNGGILTSTSGVINYDWEGEAGRVKLIVPKDSTLLKIAESKFIGGLTAEEAGIINTGLSTLITRVIAPHATQMYISSCPLLAEFTAPIATVVSASICALTAKSIGDYLWLGVYTNNPTASGTADFSGGTNATAEDITTYMGDAGYLDNSEVFAGVEAWIASVLATWTISLN